MPAKCSCCHHPDRERLDADLIEGRSLARIAQDYGVSASAAHRHKKHHITQPMKAALEARHESQVAYGSNLLRRLESLEARAQGLLVRAEQQGSLTGALSAIRETRECLRIIGQVTKEISSGPTLNVFIRSDEWQHLKTTIITALLPFPDATQAVKAALQVLAETPSPVIEPSPQPGDTDRSESPKSNLGQPETREEG